MTGLGRSTVKQIKGAAVRPLISCLFRPDTGEHADAAFHTSSFGKRFDRLTAFGMHHGAGLTPHQRKPGCVVRLGETELV